MNNKLKTTKKHIAGRPEDIAPDMSLVAGRQEYRQAKQDLRLIGKLQREGSNINDEYQLILAKKSTRSRSEREAIVRYIINRAMEKRIQKDKKEPEIESN